MDLSCKRQLLLAVLALAPWPSYAQLPAFGGELFTFATASTKNPPGPFSLQKAIPAGATVVILGAEDGNDYRMTGVTDTKGNTYTRIASYDNINFQPSDMAIWAGYLHQALDKDDRITVTWTPSPVEYRSYGLSAIYLTGVSPANQSESSASNNVYMNSSTVSIPGRTSQPRSIIVGMLLANDFNWTIGPGWMIYEHQAVNIRYDWFYKVTGLPGDQDPGGYGPKFNTFCGLWASFTSADGGSR